MGGRVLLLLFLAAAPIGSLSLAAGAGVEPMDFVYRRAESSKDSRASFGMEVLKVVLDRTRQAYGDYRLMPSPYFMSHQREIHEMQQPNSPITVILMPSRNDVGEMLLPVRIPVVTSLSYDGLFKMLMAGRFDALGRSAGEVLQEISNRKTDLPDLRIEDHLLLHYPLATYFWFANDPEGRKRAARVRDGLNAMLQDGSLDHMFQAQYGGLIKALDLDHRQVIELPNPFLTPEDPVSDQRLWYHPG